MNSLKKLGIASMLVFSPLAFSNETVQIKVKGMVCSFCAQGIKKKLSSIDGVDSVKVDLDNKTVDFQTKTGTELDDNKIKKLINDAGYDVVEISRNTK